MDLTVSVDHWVKIKESENVVKILGSYQRAKNGVEYEVENDSNFSWSPKPRKSDWDNCRSEVE